MSHCIVFTIDKTTACWICTSHAPDFRGYPRLNVNGIPTRLVRHLYELAHGELPADIVMRHKCDNPACINPYHLLTGTQAENVQDKVDRGRQANGEAISHSKLTRAIVEDILRSKESSPVLARRYGVTRGAINQIREGRTWKHVPRPESEAVAS